MVVTFDIETTGTNGYRDKVILIGMKKEGRIKQWKLWKVKNELNMIQKCIVVLEELPRLEETIVGYNNLKFDVPFLVARLSAFGEMSSEIYEVFYNRKWFDLYQFLGNDFRSLESWRRRLRIRRGREDIRGRDVPILYEKKEYKKIEQHNRDDLNTSEKLYLKLQKRFPDLLPQF